jgi:hypothetical protein
MGAGRPPKRLGEHVERLEGSADIKRRLEVILETLAGERSVLEACELLDVGEARFHELRRQVLASALEGLAPGVVGRPRREDGVSPSRVEELEREVRELRIELQAARVRTEIALTMPHLLRRHEARARKKNERQAKRRKK